METKRTKKRYPVGIQSFSKLIEEGFLYVDKTKLIYQLAKDGGYYFLSRPRRFGKSLLLSTIEAYYQGRRELFKGLDIDKLTDQWEPRPVLHIDLNSGNFNSVKALEQHLNHILRQWEAKYDISAPSESLSQRFGDVIYAAYSRAGKKAVILVDEYDK
ncbi:MAG: AAA family ATPase, partial [Lachnospiraceae bacterium]|nr:AAA family ATPase [Lachnospiraceae bacterium]